MRREHIPVALMVVGAIAAVPHSDASAAPADVIVYETWGYYGGPADIHGDLGEVPAPR